MTALPGLSGLRSLADRLRLVVLLDPDATQGQREEDLALEALRHGATAVELRGQRQDGELLDLALRLKKVVRRAGGLCIVNNRVDVALLAEADAVHLGQADLPLPLVRRLVGRKLLIGQTVHTLDQAQLAERLGADYLGVGPVFASSSVYEARAEGGFPPRRPRPTPHPPVGLDTLRQIVRTTKLPTLAWGGVTVENAPDLRLQGATGLATMRAIVGAGRVGDATRDLARAFAGVSAAP